MRGTAGGAVRALSIHAGYRCLGSGVCCSSGWDIPVEPRSEAVLRRALQKGRLRIPGPDEPAGTLRERPFRAVPGLPDGARVVLATVRSGRCVFLEADRRCAVHRQLGEDQLPSACRHFPRVATLTPLGVSVTLSHYCPTAAAMLFRDVAPAVVLDPPGFPSSWPWEGLDARDALPPLLRPGVLMDWASLDRWERFAVSVLAEEQQSPEAALDILAGAAEDARRWTPADGSFEGFFRGVLAGWLPRAGSGGRAAEEAAGAAPSSPLPRRSGLPGAAGAWRLVAESVRHRERLPAAPDGLEDADARWVAPAWPVLGRPIRRWLAARIFGSWLALQGEGLRTTVLGLEIALGVLRAEAARGSGEAGRALDEELLKEAVGRSDLLLVQLADPEALARRLSRCESAVSSTAAW